GSITPDSGIIGIVWDTYRRNYRCVQFSFSCWTLSNIEIFGKEFVSASGFAIYQICSICQNPDTIELVSDILDQQLYGYGVSYEDFGIEQLYRSGNEAACGGDLIDSDGDILNEVTYTIIKKGRYIEVEITNGGYY
ncbi:MAG: hypothetical protein ACR2PY_08640, partial [Salinispira sp.]